MRILTALTCGIVMTSMSRGCDQRPSGDQTNTRYEPPAIANFADGVGQLEGAYATITHRLEAGKTSDCIADARHALRVSGTMSAVARLDGMNKESIAKAAVVSRELEKSFGKILDGLKDPTASDEQIQMIYASVSEAIDTSLEELRQLRVPQDNPN